MSARPSTDQHSNPDRRGTGPPPRACLCAVAAVDQRRRSCRQTPPAGTTTSVALAAFRNGLPTRQQDAAVDLHDFDVGRLIDLPLAHEEPRRVRRHRGKEGLVVGQPFAPAAACDTARIHWISRQSLASLLDGSVTTTASWPGELIAHASHTLPPPGAGKPAGLHAEIDVPEIGRVRVRYRLMSGRHHKHTNWFWKLASANWSASA